MSALPLDQEGARFLLLLDRFAREIAPAEERVDGAIDQPFRFTQVKNRLGMQATAGQDAYAVPGLGRRQPQQPRGLLVLERAKRLAAREEIDCEPDVLERVDDAQERSNRHDLGPIEADTDAVRISACQELPGGRVIEGLAVVEGDGALDRLDGIVVEERPGVGCFDERGRVEGAVPGNAEAVIARDVLAGQPGGLVGQVLDAGCLLYTSPSPRDA